MKKFFLSNSYVMPKQSTVKQVFDTVAEKYDLMNDLMSFGMHRIWKKQLVTEIQPYHTHNLLDVAGGTGDIAMRFLDAGGGSATVCDINQSMLDAGVKQRIDCGKYNKYKDKLDVVCCDAQQLPFDDNSFDRVVISFGIRNVESIESVLKEMYRVLKPTGKFLCLEFLNHEGNGLAKKIYDFYSFKWLPKLGEVVVGDGSPYEYLADSIRKFPKKNDFLNMMIETRFFKVKGENVFPPVATIYSGYKV